MDPNASSSPAQVSNPKPKVVVTWPINDADLNKLREQYDVVANTEKRSLTPEELLKLVAGASAILCMLTNKITGEVMDAAGSGLKVIATMSVGYDHIDVDAAKQRNIAVTFTPGTSDNAVAEHTIALLLAMTKSVVAGDGYVREGKYTGWDPALFVGPEMKGKIMGVVGLGRIGSAVANIAGFGLGMAIAYNDIKPNPDFEAKFNAKFFAIDDLVRIADVVTLHVPLLPTTKHLINADRLARMKRTAYLINTSRGPVVDEQALVAALQNNQIAAAGLDVFENEPAVTPELLQLPNIVLTPHIASATIEARTAMADKAVVNIVAALSGQAPPDLVK